jgi:DNA modification methylase
LEHGQALIAADFGLGKSVIQLEIARLVNQKTKGKFLIIAPLAVHQEFKVKDAPMLGLQCEYVRNTDEFIKSNCDILITNYERVRDGGFNIDLLHQFHGLHGVSLDEGSVLRSLGSDTTQQFCNLFQNMPFKFVATATPSPNEYLELINYAHFLGVMDRGLVLTRFFQRDSQTAGNLTIHPQHERDFWLWVSSWAIFLSKPSDLGYSDEGYSLPELEVNWHEVKVPNEKFGLQADRDGQTKAFADVGSNLVELSKIKKGTVTERSVKALDLINDSPDDHFLLWHLREDERSVCEWMQNSLQLDIKTVYGGQTLEQKEELLISFGQGRYRILATKPEIAGSGCNFQYHCHRAIFMSIDYKFNDFIQAIHRIYRFMQVHKVTIDIIYAEQEAPVAQALQEKWEAHKKQREIMSGIIRQFGLDQSLYIENIKRKFGLERVEVKGNDFTAVNNDSILELPLIATNSIGLIHTSIPFGNHYEYSNSYNDLGHNESNEVFWKQMDFLIPELLRVTMPGRNAIIHVKDRIRFSTMTGLGSYTIDPFSDECTAAFKKHGWLFIGRITIVTDVVSENNQTYRLGWTEKCKDGSKMGCGLPEYLLIFRKQQTDLSNQFADTPIVKRKEQFTKSMWQSLASSFWRSSGDRFIDPMDIAEMSTDRIMQFFKAMTSNEVYDWQMVKALGNILDLKDKMPSTFALLAPQSHDDHVWTDILHMRGLNAQQAGNKSEKHICPLPFDIVERVIDNWSAEGDVVLDPFGGLMTVPYMAVKMNRKGYGIELNPAYFRDGVAYCQDIERKKSLPTLFDLIKVTDENAE